MSGENFEFSETRMISEGELKAFGFNVNDGSLFVQQCFRNVLQCLVREIERLVS